MRWRLIRLLGEGDAGEVYLVESFLDKRIAILKRPRQNGFPADVLRQANQIDMEACILRALSYSRLANPSSCVRIASLLDQSLPGNELTERFFIVIEKAPGLNLDFLHKLIRLGFHEPLPELEILDESAKIYVQKLLELKTIPELLVLNVLLGLFDLLEIIHQQPLKRLGSEYQGIIWNDVKLNHLYWDPMQGRLTVIDWGNGQLLEKDGISADRLYSPADDYRQMIEVMGKFLMECLPSLHQALNWPGFITPADAAIEKLVWLKDKIAGLAQENEKNLREARLRETACLSADPPHKVHLTNLAETQCKIIAHGQMPDFAGAVRLYARMASLLAEEDHWDEFHEVCNQLVTMPTSSPGKWRLLAQIYTAADKEKEQPKELFKEALHAGLNDDWPNSLWSLCKATQMDAEGSRWMALSNAIRTQMLGFDNTIQPPYSAAVHLLHQLEEDRPWIIERLTEAIASGNLSEPEKPERYFKAYETLITHFKSEVLKKWLQLDPAPPGAGLAYTEVDALLDDLSELLPRLGINARERLGELIAALAQPKAQTQIVLDAWQAKGFKTAQAGLRNLLIWDPDRRRVLQIDKILEQAPAWLEEARHGPQPGERLQEYALRMEFQCREMSRRVSNAHWIETALPLFTELRSGKKPGEVLSANPRLAEIFHWLKRYERKSAFEKGHQQTAQPGRLVKRSTWRISREGQLGQNQAIFLTEALDSWVPEAKGSSARVFLGFLKDIEGQVKQAAIKIMRLDKADYALPLFWEEAQILTILEDVSGVAKLLECGFIQPDNAMHKSAAEDSLLSAHILTGKVIRFEPDETAGFLDGIQEKVSQGWLPYLAIEKKSREDSLLLLCDEGYTRGKYLPIDQGLTIALKICDILEIAHSRNIVYRDHKILHYYWNSRLHKVSMIDWNVAKWYSQGLSETERQLDLVQFGARTLHHILTGRPAPGALPVGPNQPYEIEMAPHRYSPAWTYDDCQRIPGDLRELLAQVMAGSYSEVARLREDLLLQLPYQV